jgi:hypothetical protein
LRIGNDDDYYYYIQPLRKACADFIIRLIQTVYERRLKHSNGVLAPSLSVKRRLLDGQREEEKQNKTFAGLKYTKQHAIIIDADISASY